LRKIWGVRKRSREMEDQSLFGPRGFETIDEATEFNLGTNTKPRLPHRFASQESSRQLAKREKILKREEKRGKRQARSLVVKGEFVINCKKSTSEYKLKKTKTKEAPRG